MNVVAGHVCKEHTTVCEERNHRQNLIPTVEYGGVEVVVWNCIATSGLGRIANTGRKMNSQVYQGILQDN